MINKIWYDIPRFIGYQITKKAEVRSIDRIVWTSKDGGYFKQLKGKI